MDNAIVLLPSYGGLIGQHVLSLAKCGRETLSVYGAPIDAARCFLIEQALANTDKDVFVFIDSDISFEKSDLDKLIDDCEHTNGIISGVYVLKNGTNKIVATTKPGIQTDREDGLIPARWVGMGFCAIHRNSLRTIAQGMKRCNLPHPNGLTELFPFFLPMVYEGTYFGEDYAFCIRANNSKVPIFLDSTILVTHWGLQGYKLQK